MKKQNEFLKNTIILFLGKFCTQFISFILLPIFTHYLLTDDYGFVDLITTYVSLFVPVVTLRMDSAVFRFLIDVRDNEDGKKKIISNTLIIVLIQTLLFICIYLVFILFFNIKYKVYIIVNIVVLMFSNILLQISRGLGKTGDYSIASIITGISNLIVNAALIIVFKWNASSILISSIISNMFCCIYIIIKNKIYRYINVKLLDRILLKDLLKYSIPLIPNSLSWWIVGVSDRSIIAFFINTAANGIYTVSSKFSNILYSIFSIINMSWQETASIHVNDKDRDTFFSKMVNEIWFLFICISLIIIAILPIFFNILIGKDYIDAYTYIPILLYANTWEVLGSLIASIFVAIKKTKSVAIGTAVSAIVNLVINISMIKRFGLYAASISTLIACLITGIYRIIDCKRYIKIKLDYPKFFILTLIFSVSTTFYYINNIYLNILNLIFVCVFSVVFNKKFIKYGKDLTLERHNLRKIS